MTHAIIVGAGPAGCSCAIWLKQLGFDPILIESRDRCGGLQNDNPYSNTWIATSHSATGDSVAQAMALNVARAGVSLRLSTTAKNARRSHGLWCVEANDSLIEAPFLVLAGGCAPESGGLMARANILIGQSRSAASGDLSGKRVAVLGGGDSAFECALFCRERGASLTRVFARGLRARPQLIENFGVEALRLGTPVLDEERSMVDGEHYDFVMVMYGFALNQTSLLGLNPAMGPGGRLHVDDSCRASLDGLYAIGETNGRMHPCCVTAMADGVVAAKSIQRAIERDALSRWTGLAKRVGSTFAGLKS